jgi:hypothetical protein
MKRLLLRTPKYMIDNLHKFHRKISEDHKGTKYDNNVPNKYLQHQIITGFVTDSEDNIIPAFEHLVLSTQSVKLSTEAICFLMHMNGHTKNLFLFLIYFHVDKKTLLFNWNDYVIKEYIDFCNSIEQDEPTLGVVKETIKKLAAKKVLTNVRKGKYMLNPILVGSVDQYEKGKLLTKYCKYALNKNKNVYDELFPTIYNLKK